MRCIHVFLLFLALGTTEYVEVPPLPYAYSALEPYIDEATMKVHYEGHFRTYSNKLNAVIAKIKEGDSSIIIPEPAELLKNDGLMLKYLRKANLGDALYTPLRNNLGGYINHQFFWQCMAPKAQLQNPEGPLMEAISVIWGDFQAFRKNFTDTALNVFGSGWVWLAMAPFPKELRVITTKDQENPWQTKHVPLLGLDLWEHAYYLKHQNNRAAYIEAFFEVINWAFVQDTYKDALEVPAVSPRTPRPKMANIPSKPFAKNKFNNKGSFPKAPPKEEEL